MKIQALFILLLTFGVPALAQSDLDRLLPMHRDSAILAHTYSPDGNWFVAAGHDVVLYKTDGHAYSHRLKNLPGIATAVAFSEDSKTIAIEIVRDDEALELVEDRGSTQNHAYVFDLMVFDVASGELQNHFSGQHAKSLKYRGIALSPTGDKLATHSDGRDVIVYDVAKGKPVWEWRDEGEETVNSCYAPFAVTPDWNHFLVGLRRVDYPSKKTTDQIAMQRRYKATLKSQYISPDGKFALGQGTDTIAKVNLDTGEIIERHSPNSVRNFGCSPDLSIYLTDQSLWRPGLKEPVSTLGWVEMMRSIPISFSPDSSEVSLGVDYTDPRLIGDRKNGRKQPWNPVQEVQLSFEKDEDPDKLNVGIYGWRDFHTIDTTNGTLSDPKPDDTNIENRYGFNASVQIWSKGRIVAGYDKKGNYWQITPNGRKDKVLLSDELAAEYTGDVQPIVFGNLLIFITKHDESKRLHMLCFDREKDHALTGTVPLPEDLRLKQIEGVRVSTNQRYLAIVSDNRRAEIEPARLVTVIDRQTGETLLPSTQGWVAKPSTVRNESDVLDVSNDGKLLVWAKSKSVEIRSLPGGEIIRKLPIDRGVPGNVHLTPDGKTLWVLNGQDLVTQFDVKNGEVTAYFQFVRAKQPNQHGGSDINALIHFDPAGKVVSTKPALSVQMIQSNH